MSPSVFPWSGSSISVSSSSSSSSFVTLGSSGCRVGSSSLTVSRVKVVRRLPLALKTHRPDVVVLELGGNDGLRGQPPQMLQQNLAKMIQLSQQAHAKVIVLGMKIPPNYGTAYSKAFEQSYRTVSQQYKVQLLPFFMQGIAGNNQLMQKDLVHPNAKAQGILLNNVYPLIQSALK